MIVIAEFVVINKTYSAIKALLFIENYSRKLRIGIDTRRKGNMLLSLLLSSCIVVPLKEVANILNSSTTKETIINPIVYNTLNIDIDIDIPRRRSALSSINCSRVALAHLNTSSNLYHERMEIQSKKLSWNEQVDINKWECFSLLYTAPKVGENIPANKDIDHSSKNEVQYTNNEIPALNNVPTL